MECRDIREKLSAYIDGEISSQEKARIDEHLKACRKCKGAFADLKKALHYVQNLEEIEPPPWLTGKVMALVRSEAEEKRGILRRLFYPLHIKLPIETIAAILIAFTTIYVFKAIQPEVQREKELQVGMRPRILSGGQGKASLPKKPKRELMLAEEREIAEGKSVEPPEVPTSVVVRDKIAPSAGDVAKKSRAISPELKGGLGEQGARTGRLTIRVKDIGTAAMEIEKALLQCGGKIIARKSVGHTHVFSAELDAGKMGSFLQKVNRIGEIEEKALVSGVPEGSVEVTIEISEKP